MGSTAQGQIGPGQPLPMDPAEFVNGALAGVLSFGFQRVSPPSPLYIQRDDVLVIKVSNATPAGDTVNVAIRLLLPTGQQPAQPVPQGAEIKSIPFPDGPGYVQTITVTVTCAGNGASGSLTVPLAEGFLLSVSAISATAQEPGATLAVIYLGRAAGAGVAPTFAYLLVNDYSTGSMPVGWPGITKQNTLSGKGTVQAVNIANPAAGADWTFASSTLFRTRVIGVTALLTTAVAVATRDVHLAVQTSGGTTLMLSTPGVTQAASLAWTYSAWWGGPVVNDSATALIVTFALPQADLQPGNLLKSITTNLQAADQWSAINLQCEFFQT